MSISQALFASACVFLVAGAAAGVSVAGNYRSKRYKFGYRAGWALSSVAAALMLASIWTAVTL